MNSSQSDNDKSNSISNWIDKSEKERSNSCKCGFAMVMINGHWSCQNDPDECMNSDKPSKRSLWDKK